MSEKFFKELREKLSATGLKQLQIAKQTGIQQASLSRFMNGTQETLNGDAVIKLIEWLGGSISFASQNGDVAKDVCFVNTHIVDAEYYREKPVAEDYAAAPLVGEVGAGPGYLPQETIKSWVLVYKHQPAIRHRRNLIAVEIGKSSISMQPTLNPEDIVLVDRDDKEVQDGHIMLVLDPDDRSGMVKRVSMKKIKNDIQLTFYSDNAILFPPSVYSLNEDFEGDWNKAIVGRVIWAWADMRKR